MKPAKNIEKTVKNLDLGIDTNAQADQVVLSELLEVQKKPMKQDSAIALPNIGRFIMKSPITKVAVAAVIITAITLGLFEFIGTSSSSGVVWAEVAKNVEASSGIIFRIRKTGSGDPNDQWPKGYTIMQRNATLSRTDWYRGDKIHRTVYFDLVGKTKIWVAHDASVYSKEAMSDEEIQKMQVKGLGWTDPQALINRGLTREHHKLGQKTIDGVLCEGLEAKGPDGSTGRLWVGLETGYPVLVEIEGVDGTTGTMDQFQWNVDLSPENVEPEIPADYRPLE